MPLFLAHPPDTDLLDGTPQSNFVLLLVQLYVRDVLAKEAPSEPGMRAPLSKFDKKMEVRRSQRQCQSARSESDRWSMCAACVGVRFLVGTPTRQRGYDRVRIRRLD